MASESSPISKFGGNPAFIAAKALAEAQVEGALSVWRGELATRFAEAVQAGNVHQSAEALAFMEMPPAGFVMATTADLDCVPFGLIVRPRYRPALGWTRSQHKPWKSVPHGDRKTWVFAVPTGLAVPEPWAGLLRMKTEDRA